MPAHTARGLPCRPQVFGRPSSPDGTVRRRRLPVALSPTKRRCVSALAGSAACRVGFDLHAPASFRCTRRKRSHALSRGRSPTVSADFESNHRPKPCVAHVVYSSALFERPRQRPRCLFPQTLGRVHVGRGSGQNVDFTAVWISVFPPFFFFFCVTENVYGVDGHLGTAPTHTHAQKQNFGQPINHRERVANHDVLCHLLAHSIHPGRWTWSSYGLGATVGHG